MSHINLNEYNDRNFPIEPIWALKSTVPSLILLPFLVTLFTFLYWGDIRAASTTSVEFYKGLIYPGFFILSVPIHFFTNVLRRATFHYQFEEKFLSLKQGIINRQNRQLPYGVIQNILVTRGLLDRIFGLSTITIQNATQSSAHDLKSQAAGSAGFFGNTIQIPGLSKDNAEEIKTALLQKIKDSPTVELGM